MTSHFRLVTFTKTNSMLGITTVDGSEIQLTTCYIWNPMRYSQCQLVSQISSINSGAGYSWLGWKINLSIVLGFHYHDWIPRDVFFFGPAFFGRFLAVQPGLPAPGRQWISEAVMWLNDWEAWRFTCPVGRFTWQVEWFVKGEQIWGTAILDGRRWDKFPFRKVAVGAEVLFF